jgi:uncharacterized protein
VTLAPGPVDEIDSAGDGTPGFLRLDKQADQQAFRRWFTYLAEVQYFTPVAQRPAEISDCAALVRYAYRQALCLHDERWCATAHLILVPALSSIAKYNYPHTPLSAALFRLRPGPFQHSDLKDGTFGQFANVETLERFNTFYISRDMMHAQPGDLLFFRRAVAHMPFHSMIFIGESQFTPGATRYMVYHTGPETSVSGDVRRLSLNELLHYPDPQWRAVPANPSFLGIFRWNILRPMS